MSVSTVLDWTRICPACRGGIRECPRLCRPHAYQAEVLDNRCLACNRIYPTVAGLADFRLTSDRYLDLTAERAKAERLSLISETTDLEGVARAYYAMTDDVDPARCKQFLAHILGAEARGDAFMADLDEQGPTLEIGCGTGGLLVAAALRGWQIEGADIGGSVVSSRSSKTHRPRPACAFNRGPSRSTSLGGRDVRNHHCR